MRFIKKLNMLKSILLFSSLILIISFILSNKILIKNAPNNVSLSILDLLIFPAGSGGIIGSISLTFPIVPIYCFILMKLLELDNTNALLLKNESRKKIWDKQSEIVILLSFIYSLFIVVTGYIISGILIGDFSNRWADNNSLIHYLVGNYINLSDFSASLNTTKILALTFCGVFLGLCAIGFLINVLSIKLKNIYSMIILIIIIFLDALVDKFSIILSQMTLDINNILDTRSTIINNLYLIFMCVTFYIIGKGLINKKDFLNIKE